MKNKTGGVRIAVPTTVRWGLVRTVHDDAKHFVVDKTLDRLQRFYWFPKMRRYVKSYISLYKMLLPTKTMRKGERPLACGRVWSICGVPSSSFIKSHRGNTHILVVVDHFTKHVVELTSAEQVYYGLGNGFQIKSLWRILYRQRYSTCKKFNSNSKSQRTVWKG